MSRFLAASSLTDFVMRAPQADRITPMFHSLLLDEPVPRNGRLNISGLGRPGFGVRRNP